MIQRAAIALLLTISILILSKCSASTDTRYSKESEKQKTEDVKLESIVEDDFDIAPFKTKLDIPEKKKEQSKQPIDLWLGYDDTVPSSQNEKSAVDTMPGFRVQVLSTDDLDEANSTRSEIYFKTNEKSIYILFEPPFYVVRVGDFKNINDAKAMSFKLNQLGFSGTKVVSDSIIVNR